LPVLPREGGVGVVFTLRRGIADVERGLVQVEILGHRPEQGRDLARQRGVLRESFSAGRRRVHRIPPSSLWSIHTERRMSIPVLAATVLLTVAPSLAPVQQTATAVTELEGVWTA